MAPRTQHCINAWERWTPAEDAYIRENHATMTHAAMAKALGRTGPAVGRRASVLRAVAPIQRWTPAELAILHECYESGGVWAVQLALNLRLDRYRQAYSICDKARKLGLTRRHKPG